MHMHVLEGMYVHNYQSGTILSSHKTGNNLIFINSIIHKLVYSCIGFYAEIQINKILLHAHELSSQTQS